jgi:hypothetical protein
MRARWLRHLRQSLARALYPPSPLAYHAPTRTHWQYSESDADQRPRETQSGCKETTTPLMQSTLSRSKGSVGRASSYPVRAPARAPLCPASHDSELVPVVLHWK